MITTFKGVPIKDIPFIMKEISAAIQSNDPKLDNCNEVIAIGRKNLFSWLKSQGNKKMLKRARSKKCEFYMLLLNHSAMTLKLVSLPFEGREIQIDRAA